MIADESTDMKIRDILLPLLIIFILGMILYGHVLRAPFYLDDYRYIVHNTAIRDLGNLSRVWESDFERVKFITFVTFALNYHWGGYDPLGYHIVNIALHVLTVFLFYVFLLALWETPWFRQKTPAEQRQPFALIASLIFLVHPLQTQSVTYIWSRSEILSAFFCFLTLWAYLMARYKRSMVWGVLSALFFFIGLLARGNLIILPLLLALMEVSFLKERGLRPPEKQGRGRLFTLAGLICVPGLIILAPFIVDILKIDWLWFGSLISPKVYLLTQWRVIVQYMRLALIPLNQNFDYDFPLSQGLFEPATFFSLLILISVCAAAGRLWSRHRVLSFGIFWFLIFLLPVSTLLPLNLVMAESRMYLPLAGYAMFLIGLLGTGRISHLRPSVRWITVAAIVLTLSILTIKRNVMWRSPLVLLEDTVKKSPSNHRAYQMLGEVHYRKGDLKKAYEFFQKAIALAPGYPDPHNDLGLVYMELGESAKAEAEFRDAMRLNPHLAAPYLNLAYLKMDKNLQEAEKLLKQSIAVQETEAANLGMGHIRILQNQHEWAKGYFSRVLEFTPRSSRAYYYLGEIALFQKRFEEARAMYQKAIDYGPAWVEPYRGLGETYVHLGNLTMAKKNFQKALELAPRRKDIQESLSHLEAALPEGPD